MARYTGPVCRLCRREGEKLFLKGERCYTGKCAVERREGPPGQHTRGRQSRSDFKFQLRQKQKVKRMYGMLEKQFRRTFTQVASTSGVTGTELLILLERRLDNVVYRLGFGSSRAQARQLVGHRHVLVNGKVVDRASAKVKVGDIVEIKEKSKKAITVQAAIEAASGRLVPEWLSMDKNAVRGTVNAFPTRDQMSQTINEQLIVELYSK